MKVKDILPLIVNNDVTTDFQNENEDWKFTVKTDEDIKKVSRYYLNKEVLLVEPWIDGKSLLITID